MAETASFCSGGDPPFRIAQVNGVSDIVREQGEASPFGDGDRLRHKASFSAIILTFQLLLIRGYQSGRHQRHIAGPPHQSLTRPLPVVDRFVMVRCQSHHR
jgi:hypothetical protein